MKKLFLVVFGVGLFAAAVVFVSGIFLQFAADMQNRTLSEQASVVVCYRGTCAPMAVGDTLTMEIPISPDGSASEYESALKRGASQPMGETEAIVLLDAMVRVARMPEDVAYMAMFKGALGLGTPHQLLDAGIRLLANAGRSSDEISTILGVYLVLARANELDEQASLLVKHIELLRITQEERRGESHRITPPRKTKDAIWL